MTGVRGRAVVALLVVLAGCSALPGGDGGPPGTTLGGEAGDSSESVGGRSGEQWPPTTAAPDGPGRDENENVTVTRLPPSVAMNHPPGVGPDGIYDVDALAASHERRLSQVSYSLELTASTLSADEEEASRLVHRVESDPRAGRLHVRVVATALNSTTPTDRVERAVYRANGTTLVRGANETVDATLPDPPSTAGDATLRFDPKRTTDAAALLSAFEIEEVRRRRSTAGTRYLLLSDTLASPESLADAPDARVTNASLVALLDPSAVVRRLHVEYDLRHNGTTTREVRDLRVTRLGTTAVTTPAWARATLRDSSDGNARNGTDAGEGTDSGDSTDATDDTDAGEGTAATNGTTESDTAATATIAAATATTDWAARTATTTSHRSATPGPARTAGSVGSTRGTTALAIPTRGDSGGSGPPGMRIRSDRELAGG